MARYDRNIKYNRIDEDRPGGDPVARKCEPSWKQPTYSVGQKVSISKGEVTIKKITISDDTPSGNVGRIYYHITDPVSGQERMVCAGSFVGHKGGKKRRSRKRRSKISSKRRSKRSYKRRSKISSKRRSKKRRSKRR